MIPPSSSGDEVDPSVDTPGGHPVRRFRCRQPDRKTSISMNDPEVISLVQEVFPGDAFPYGGENDSISCGGPGGIDGGPFFPGVNHGEFCDSIILNSQCPDRSKPTVTVTHSLENDPVIPGVPFWQKPVHPFKNVGLSRCQVCHLEDPGPTSELIGTAIDKACAIGGPTGVEIFGAFPADADPIIRGFAVVFDYEDVPFSMVIGTEGDHSRILRMKIGKAFVRITTGDSSENVSPDLLSIKVMVPTPGGCCEDE